MAGFSRSLQTFLRFGLGLFALAVLAVMARVVNQ